MISFARAPAMRPIMIQDIMLTSNAPLYSFYCCIYSLVHKKKTRVSRDSPTFSKNPHWRVWRPTLPSTPATWEPVMRAMLPGLLLANIRGAAGGVVNMSNWGAWPSRRR